MPCLGGNKESGLSERGVLVCLSLTEETGHAGVCGVGGVQVGLVGVQAGGRDGQVAAQAVDVLHQRHVHLQRPLAAGLLGVPRVDARTPAHTHTHTHKVEYALGGHKRNERAGKK